MARKKRTGHTLQAALPGNASSARSPIDRSWIWAGAIILLFFVIRIGLRDMPLERDEGIYAYFGQLLWQGAIPYVDFYEMKPPALYYSYALLWGLSGGDMAVMHISFALVHALSAWFLFLLARRLFDGPLAVVAVATHSVLSLSLFASGYTIQAAHLVVLFACSGSWAFVKGRQLGSWKLIALGGALLCTGVLVKQNGMFFAVLAAIMALVPARGAAEPWRDAFGRTLALGAGAILAMVIFIAPVLYQGAWDEFLYFIVEVPLTYVSEIPWSEGGQALAQKLGALWSEDPLLWSLGVLGLPSLAFLSIGRWNKIFVLGFFLAAFLSVVPGFRFYSHYFLQLAPAIALGSAAAIGLIRQRSGATSKHLQRIPFISAIILIAIALGTSWAYYFVPQAPTVMRSLYGSNLFMESKLLSDHLNILLLPSDQLVVFGSEPQIYAYTQAASPSRHIYLATLVGPHPKREAWIEEFKSDLGRTKAKYAVWVNHPVSWQPREGEDQAIIRWCLDYTNTNYRPIAFYDQLPNGSIQVVEGTEAERYRTQGEYFLVLLQRL